MIARATKVARLLLAVASVAQGGAPSSAGTRRTGGVPRDPRRLHVADLRERDLLILHAADRYGVGDVVGYRVPDGEFGEGHLVVHRIVAGDGGTGFVLEGDNNPAPDPWLPKTVDVVGRP